MAGIFDFITGRDTPPGLGATPEQPSMGARFGAAVKRKVGDTLGAMIHNPIARAAGGFASDFANEYWGGGGTKPAAPAPGFGFTKPSYISPSYGVAPSAVSPTDMDAHRAAYDAANSAPGGWMSPGGFDPSMQPDKYGVRPKYDANGNLAGSENSRVGVTWNANTGQPEGGKFAAAGGYNNYAAGEDLGPHVNGYGAGRGSMIGGVPIDTRSSYDGSMGGFVGAVMNQKRAAATGARQIAEAKILADVYGKGPGAAKATAEAQKENMASNIALRLADPNTSEPERERLKTAAGALFGRFESSSASVPAGYMGDFKTDVPMVTNRGPGAGTVKLVTPTQSLSFSQAKAQAMKNPQYKFTSDAQLRRDLEATGKYKLTD